MLWVRFVLVAAEACNFARRLHLDSKTRIRVLEAAEAELRNFTAHELNVDRMDTLRSDLDAHHHFGRNLDEIDVEGLRDERERARRAEVELDDLDSGISI